MDDNLQMSGGAQKTEFPRNSSHIWKGILTALFTMLIGGLVILIIGGVMRGTHIADWLTYSITGLIITGFFTVAMTCIFDWSRLYGAYTCGDDRQALRLSKREKIAYKQVRRTLGIPGALKKLGLI